MSPEEIRAKLLTPAFPISKLTELLDHDNHQMRQDFRYSLNFCSLFMDRNYYVNS